MIDRLGNRAMLAALATARRPRPGERGGGLELAHEPAVGGSALPAAQRGRFEQALGLDLSDVRVHTDDQADRAARSIDATAFTTGRDIYFRRGAYGPGTPAGDATLAHEVAHTVQGRVGRRAGVSAAGEAGEREADRAVPALLSGAPVRLRQPAAAIARQEPGTMLKPPPNWLYVNYPGYSRPGSVVIPPTGPTYLKPPLSSKYELKMDPKLAALASIDWRNPPAFWPASSKDTDKEEDDGPSYTSWLLTVMQAATAEKMGNNLELMQQYGRGDKQSQFQTVALYRYTWSKFEFGGQASITKPKDLTDGAKNLGSSFSLGPVAHYFEKDAIGSTFDVGFFLLPTFTWDAEKKQAFLSVQVVAAFSRELWKSGKWKLGLDANVSPTLMTGGGQTLGGTDLGRGGSWTAGLGLGLGTPWVDVGLETYGVWTSAYDAARLDRLISASRGAIGLSVSKALPGFVRFLGAYGSYQWDSAKLDQPGPQPPLPSGKTFSISGVVGF
jgi:uncharacterized protein DUF4157